MSKQSIELPNYIVNPYPWLSHYNEGDRFSTEHRRYLPVPRTELLIHTIELIFPECTCSFSVELFDRDTVAYSLFHIYMQSDHCRRERMSEKFIELCQKNYFKLKSHITLLSRNRK